MSTSNNTGPKPKQGAARPISQLLVGQKRTLSGLPVLPAAKVRKGPPTKWMWQNVKDCATKANTVICLHCNKELSKSNITRVKEHLLNRKCAFLNSKEAAESTDQEVIQARAAVPSKTAKQGSVEGSAAQLGERLQACPAAAAVSLHQLLL